MGRTFCSVSYIQTQGTSTKSTDLQNSWKFNYPLWLVCSSRLSYTAINWVYRFVLWSSLVAHGAQNLGRPRLPSPGIGPRTYSPIFIWLPFPFCVPWLTILSPLIPCHTSGDQTLCCHSQRTRWCIPGSLCHSACDRNFHTAGNKFSMRVSMVAIYIVQP